MLRSFCAPRWRTLRGSVLNTAAFGLSAVGAAVASSPPSIAELQAAADAARLATGVPGLVFALVDADRVISVASGLRAAAPAAASPFLPTDEVHIGSNFKAITAAVVARLVDRGLIGWESTLGEVFPELAGQAHPETRGVTVRQLLAHRGGIDDTAVFALLESLDASGSGRAVRAAAIPTLLASPPQVPIGEYAYSNVGYALAGGVVERVLGIDFEEAVRAEFSGPLGITTLAVGAPGTDDLADVTAPLGHDPLGSPMTPTEQAFPLAIEPAGTFRVTINDWAEFIRATMGVPSAGDTFLSAAAIAELQKPVGSPILADGTGYALGWVTVRESDQDVLFHDGSNTFWYSSAFVNPGLDRAILFAGNQEDAGAAASELLVRLPEVQAWLLGGGAVPEPGGIVAALVAASAGFATRRRS